jgi:hypothetical protein
MKNQDSSSEFEEFLEKIREELLASETDGEPQRMLAAVQDSDTGIYMLLMAVPATALDDGMGPDIWRTPDEKKFLAAFSEEILIEKADEISLQYEDLDEQNNAMAEYIGSFVPDLFQRAAALPKLAI